MELSNLIVEKIQYDWLIRIKSVLTQYALTDNTDSVEILTSSLLADVHHLCCEFDLDLFDLMRLAHEHFVDEKFAESEKLINQSR